MLSHEGEARGLAVLRRWLWRELVVRTRAPALELSRALLLAVPESF